MDPREHSHIIEYVPSDITKLGTISFSVWVNEHYVFLRFTGKQDSLILTFL